MSSSPAQVVAELLDVGPVLNAIDADGCSALHLAAQDGHAAVVRQLKEHGIVDGLPNLAGCCPADLARQHGHARIAKVLAEGAVSKARRLGPHMHTWPGRSCRFLMPAPTLVLGDPHGCCRACMQGEA